MKYFVELNGETTEVTIDGRTARIGADTLEASLTALSGTPVYLVTLNGNQFQCVVQRGSGRGNYTVSAGGHRFTVTALDERDRAIRDITAAAGKTAGPQPVAAPMPGLVVRVNVAAGDSVTPGTGVVVMEAMKMENELRAHSGGMVKAVRVQPGQAVEKGAVLVEFE